LIWACVSCGCDWKIGLTKDLGRGFTLAVAYVDTNARESFYTSANRGRYLCKAAAWASIARAF